MDGETEVSEERSTEGITEEDIFKSKRNFSRRIDADSADVFGCKA